MRVIPHYLPGNYGRIGHPVLDALADDLAASFADTVEKPIPRNLAVLLLRLDDDPDPSVKQEADNGPKNTMAHIDGTSRTAIVVEDDADERSLVAALLEETEFRILECESGEAALAAMRIRGNDVALMFADLRLAGVMDGADLARVVKTGWPHLTVVVSSDLPERRIENLPDDVVVLPKPWLALDVLMIAEQARSSAQLLSLANRAA
jgi:CheY-like chemotaxis protein